MADDYCVVQGYPGTGKTEVLAQLLELSMRNGQRVLFCSYTNAAVDNALLRLLKKKRNKELNMVRVGSGQKIHQDIKPYMLDKLNIKSTADVEAFVKNESNPLALVACTLLGAHDNFVQTLDFDIAVVDEASQATEPSTWCALFRTKKFILFGDTNQLPPLVRHPKATQFGLGVPLMERLARAHPQCV